MAKKCYTDEQREAAVAVLMANNGNLKKTALETGISRATLREWKNGLPGQSPLIATLKKEFAGAYREKLRQAREAGLDRMLELIPRESDLHKVTGAVKVLSELNITEEVAEDYTRSQIGISATSSSATDTGEATAISEAYN